MKFQEMRWAGDLLVSCTIDGKPAIFRTPKYPTISHLIYV